MQVSAPTPRLSLRRTRLSRLPRQLPVRRRRQQPSWRLLAAAAVPLVVLGVVAYVGRRRFLAEARAKADGAGE
jgi:hypothetical protein